MAFPPWERLRKPTRMALPFVGQGLTAAGGFARLGLRQRVERHLHRFANHAFHVRAYLLLDLDLVGEDQDGEPGCLSMTGENTRKGLTRKAGRPAGSYQS